MKFPHLVVLSLLFSFSFPTFAITLEDYLQEVEAKNGSIKALKKSSEAKELRFDEGTLFFKPSFFLTGEYFDDQRPTNAPVFQGTQTLRHTLRTGFGQNLRTGTRASISYNYNKTQINGANQNLLPNRKFFDVFPSIEISQSLLRNFLGSEFEAQETIQNSQTEASRFNDIFTRKQLLIQAENAYWKLYFTQSTLKVLKDSLDRAKKLKEWNLQRVKSNLVDETELLQAEANLQTREIEYQDTVTEIDAALKEFNSIRENTGDVHLADSQDLNRKSILKAKVPTKLPMREDVRAYLASQKVAEASAELGKQRNRPSLELYANVALNGRDNNSYNEALDQAASATRPFSIFGFRFTTPLDPDSMKDYKKAYAQESVAAEMAYKRKSYEVDREWEILTERFENFKTRLQLTQKLEKVQEKKLTQEKRRYQQGRTTTFQVLQFEQDYANTQLIKLRYERELILIYNQLKLFSGASI